MQTSTNILADLRACRLCHDLPLGPKPLFQLHPSARILIAGQAPGRITHEIGRPFDDPSGGRLRQWLGVHRDTFYGDPRIGIFPMGMCFPGTRAGGDLPPRKICAATWRAPVMQMLRDVELTLILGGHALAWHLPHLKGGTVTQAVQQTATGAGGVFVLPHPSPRNNRWLKKNPWFVADVVPAIQQRVQALLAAN